MTPDSFTREAIATKLKHMFRPEGHLNICDIDTCLSLLKIVPNKAQYDALKLLHCVSWSAMEPGMREQVYKRVLAIFAEGTSFDLSAIDRGFMLNHAPDIGKVVAIQEGREAKRKVLGLWYGGGK